MLNTYLYVQTPLSRFTILNFWVMKIICTIKEYGRWGTSLVIQCLGLHASNMWGSGLIPDGELESHIQHGTAKK